MRDIWSGSISFGLVNIPIKLYSAAEEREFQFHLLHREDSYPIRYARICSKDGREVSYEDLVKGFEYKKGNYVILTREDFDSVDVRKTKTIDISNFADDHEVESKYYEKPYYLEPDKGAEKAYTLMREALKRSKKAAIGKFVLRNKEILCVIKPDANLLILHKLRYSDQIRDPASLKLPKEEFIESEVEAALKLIENLSGPFEPEKYHDTYSGELREIIEKKAKGEMIVPASKELPVPTRAEDLLKMLKASLEKTKPSP
ncbi:Ku protein [Candidatus Parcubacteria bacterium]|nr:MAG: Ku protein [Candidatus Parcubacteria bacterium]